MLLYMRIGTDCVTKKTLEITEQLSNNTFSIAYTLVFESTTLKLKYKLSNL